MLKAAIWGEMAVLAACILLLLTQLNYDWLYQIVVELFVIGRIPGTELYIQFEPFFAGMVTGLWLIWAYKIYSVGITKAHKLVTADVERVASLEEIAL